MIMMSFIIPWSCRPDHHRHLKLVMLNAHSLLTCLAPYVSIMASIHVILHYIICLPCRPACLATLVALRGRDSIQFQHLSTFSNSNLNFQLLNELHCVYVLLFWPACFVMSSTHKTHKLAWHAGRQVLPSSSFSCHVSCLTGLGSKRSHQRWFGCGYCYEIRSVAFSLIDFYWTKIRCKFQERYSISVEHFLGHHKHAHEIVKTLQARHIISQVSAPYHHHLLVFKCELLKLNNKCVRSV